MRSVFLLFRNFFVVIYIFLIWNLNATSWTGGVLLAVKNCICSEDADLSHIKAVTPYIHLIRTKISEANSFSVFVLSVYIPLMLSVDDFELFFDILEKLVFNTKHDNNA